MTGSPLWMKLRAARRGANLTQLQIAKALGITRPGYAFHETAHDDSRTVPNVEQIKRVAELTGVPAELLINDDVSVEDVIRAQLGSDSSPPAPRVARPVTMPGLLRAAVQFGVASRAPERSGAFGAVLALGPLPVELDYLHARTACVMLGEPSQAEVREAIGRLLLAEKIVGRPLQKLVVVWARQPQDASGLGAAVHAATGVSVAVVATPEEAAALLVR